MQFFPFGFEKHNETASIEELGGKGAGLVWLANEGVPVPPGFVIPTSVWAEYDKKPKTTMKLIAKAIPAYLAKLEAHFGYMPLLSVRSGARVSCPGMMDTILNVGLEASNIPAWIERLGPKCFGDSFHRLVSMYGSVVKGLRKESFAGNLKDALEAYQQQTGADFPKAQDQLLGAIEAVFKSWDNDRANEYRKMHGYDRAWGTAVTVQAMVFGNLNDQSASGVLFTRNPDTGEAKVTGEYLKNAQGEDIVAGLRTPNPLHEMGVDMGVALQEELFDTVLKLEALKKEMLDIEFTIQDGTLYLLQVRSGKRSATAAIKIAVGMAKEGLIDAKTAVKRVSAKQFDLAQMATLDPKFTKDPAFVGIPACSGVVSGKPVFSKADAINCKEPCILVSHETTPDDITGMKAAVGVVTMVGGLTSHAAVVARGMDRTCIVGVGQSIEAFKDVEVLSLDGATGRIWTEAVPIVGGSTNGIVTEFKALVSQTLGVVPVVFDVPAEPMDEVLLYLGDKVLNPGEAFGIVVKTLNKVNKLYLDLVPTQAEQRYLNIVGTYNYIGLLLARIEGVLPEVKQAKIVLIAAPEVKTKLQRLSAGSDLRSLVLSDDEIVLDGANVNDPAIAKVLKWKQAEGGVKVVSLGKYVEGGKSMLSINQSLQILGV